jgi:hypothetical protein
VHLVRASLNYVPRKQRKQVAADLQLIYRAATAAEAHGTWRNWNENGRISQFEPGVAAQMAPLFHYPPEIRKTIYTTNAVEALNRSAAQDYQNPQRLPNAFGKAAKGRFLPHLIYMGSIYMGSRRSWGNVGIAEEISKGGTTKVPRPSDSRQQSGPWSLRMPP